MRKPSRYMAAFFLMMIYLFVNLVDLVPIHRCFATASRTVAVECSGDCAICGCSPERRANRTCCCWQKRFGSVPVRQSVPECCKMERRHDVPIMASYCPCGNNGLPALLGEESPEKLPYRFAERVMAPHEGTLVSSHRHRLLCRDPDPPDPPPKLSLPLA